MIGYTFEPAWSYPRHGWGLQTGLSWHTTHHGDELRLWLPPGLIGITIHDDRGLEALAWQEARLGDLRPTWITRPAKSRYGTAIYSVQDGFAYHPTITYAVTVETGNIPVWPTPTEDGDRWAWFDRNGVPLLGSPDKREFTDLPQPWQEDLRSTRQGTPAQDLGTEDLFRIFVNQTFVPNGPEHQLTSDEIYSTYRQWADMTDLPPTRRGNKIHLSRWISESLDFHRWAGRTPAGYRRGFTGLRFPDGAWNK